MTPSSTSTPDLPHPSVRGRVFFRLLFAAVVVGPFLLHELFHFADWLVWGLNFHGVDAVRTALYPYFGAEDMLGFVSHAVVNGWTLAMILYLAWSYLRAKWPSTLLTSASSASGQSRRSPGS